MVSKTSTLRRRLALVVSVISVAAAAGGCREESSFKVDEPGAGPGDFVGLDAPLNESFAGGVSPDIEARSFDGNPDWQVCDKACQEFCAAQPFANPVDEAMCPFLWGAGYDTLPINETQACRRLYADFRGTFPTYQELQDNCLGRPLGDVALELIKDDDFVLQNRRRWADLLRYNNIAVSLERIYDADSLVTKLYRGRLRYDDFVEVVSAHPVFVRRYDDASDRAEGLFDIFVGRPPFDNERADMSKLYTLWSNGYHTHPEIGLTFPDAFVEHKCVTEKGELDEDTAGQCTSVLWGFNRVILYPDFRSIDNQTWSGNFTKEEWELLQTPGRIIGAWPQTWENAVNEALTLYLDYDPSAYTPALTQRLVEYVLSHGGDIRAAHYAIATSQLYLQSTECSDEACSADEEAPPWLRGPLRQAEAELWVDSLDRATGTKRGKCDHRLPAPEDLLERTSVTGYEIVEKSRWELTDEDEIDDRYASLVRTLGGCPDNLTAGRFKAVSILNTATQEAFVNNLCNPAMADDVGVSTKVILPSDVPADAVLSPELATQIIDYQIRQFFSRTPIDEELIMAETGAAACVPKPCTAESFARAACYALLSSSEMLFY